MTYLVEYLSGKTTGGTAFTYDVPSKSLVAADSRVSVETGSDYWALKVNGDYSMIFDVDGLLVGDMEVKTRDEFPRLDFLCLSCGVRQRMASLSQSGRLSVNDVTETNTLPAGLNILDNVVLTKDGLFSTKVNEVWFLSSNGDYVVSNGQLIRIRA